MNVLLILFALTTLTAAFAGCMGDDEETDEDTGSGVDDDQNDPEGFDSGANPPPPVTQERTRVTSG